MNGLRYFLKNLWTGPYRCIELGFLLSVFFAPWTPGPRYLGWGIALFSWLALTLKGRMRRKALPPLVLVLFVFILLLGGLVTALLRPDPYAWIKGFSMPLEFFFAVWLSSFVLAEEDAENRWVTVWYASCVLTLVVSLLKILTDSKESGGIFSNINTLGLYLCLLLPFVFSFPCREKIRGWRALACQGLSVVCFLLLIASFSLAAWMTGGLELCLLLFLSKGFKMRILGTILVSCMVGWALFVTLSWISPVKAVSFFKAGEREVAQMTSLHNPDQFTDKREGIWRATLPLVARRPWTGWGWGSVDDLVPKRDAHNMYLNLAVQGGVFTVFCVVVLYLWALKEAWYKRKKNTSEAWLWNTVLATVISQFFYGLAGDVFSFRYRAALYFWMLLGLAFSRKEK